MRFMILLKANQQSESGKLPSAELLREMGRYNEELIQAGVMIDGGGLQPSAKGARVRLTADGKRTVIDGPFAETKQLIAGYWMFQVASKQEAIEWVRRCPQPLEGEAEIEIRQLYEVSDFPDVPPEVKAQVEREQAKKRGG